MSRFPWFGHPARRDTKIAKAIQVVFWILIVTMVGWALYAMALFVGQLITRPWA